MDQQGEQRSTRRMRRLRRTRTRRTRTRTRTAKRTRKKTRRTRTRKKTRTRTRTRRTRTGTGTRKKTRRTRTRRGGRRMAGQSAGNDLVGQVRQHPSSRCQAHHGSYEDPSTALLLRPQARPSLHAQGLKQVEEGAGGAGGARQGGRKPEGAGGIHLRRPSDLADDKPDRRAAAAEHVSASALGGEGGGERGGGKVEEDVPMP
eukprot:760103-Hanusia_phi.AAC.5